MKMFRTLAKSLGVITLTAAIQLPIGPSAYATESTSIMGGSWTITSTDSEAKVSWDLPVSNARVSLYRDAVLLDNSDSHGEYLVPEVRPDENLDFTLVVSAPLTVNQISALSASENLSESKVRSNFEQSVISGMDLKVPAVGTIGITSAQAATALPDSTAIRYATFIRNYSIDAPPFGVCSPIIGKYRFLGDNRGFNPDSSAYRTRFDVNIHWLTNTSSAIRLVGQTKRQVYSDTSNAWFFDATATASNSTMTYKTLAAQTSSMAYFNIHQDVVNPMCDDLLTNGVYFDYNVKVYRTGSYVFSGTSLLAPDHELYIRDSDATSWTTVYQKQVKTTDCLAIVLYNLNGCTTTGTYSGLR